MFVVITICLVVVATLVTYLMTSTRASSRIANLQNEVAGLNGSLYSLRTDAGALQDELRRQCDEAKQREQSAVARVNEADKRIESISEELKRALQDKAQAQNEATRVEELRAQVAERDSENSVLNRTVTELERKKAEALKDAEAAGRRSDDTVANERNAQRRILAAKDEQIEQLEQFVSGAKDALTTEFKAISAETLKDVSVELARTADGIIGKHEQKTTADVKLHHQQIETMLKPVEETIKRLDKQVEESNLARSRAEALLDDQVKRLAGASESLTNALRKPVVRGSWGEMTLENALENAGLEAEIDFVLQHSTDNEDGRKRTDAIINLPKGRKLIIDSKNLMESYLALASSNDEAHKAILTEAHSKSLRSHIKALASKEYWRRYDGLDCVILFIPHDGMYHSAIRDESELIREASDKRVFISNPMSLIPLLKAIRYVLDQERLNKSAEEISTVGAELYGEITRFATNLAMVGKRLKDTVKAYNDVIPGLDRFILSKARRLKQLGTAKGSEADLPEPIELDQKLFASQEMQAANLLLQTDVSMSLSD